MKVTFGLSEGPLDGGGASLPHHQAGRAGGNLIEWLLTHQSQCTVMMYEQHTVNWLSARSCVGTASTMGDQRAGANPQPVGPTSHEMS